MPRPRALRPSDDSQDPTSDEPPSPSGPAAATRSRTLCALASRVGAGASAPLTAAQADALAGRGLGEHGCKHYRRRARLVAPCCGEVFWCRHCHNEAKAANEWDPSKRHELERTAVRELVCALCDTRQPASRACTACGASFGAYACLQCCFFDDDARKRQFHCDACGICRVGGADNFFHCATCGCCYSRALRGNHVCVENSMRQNCPVCFEYLFDSVRPTAVLPCGHTIHSDCLKEMERNRALSCPICMKSYADLGPVWRRLDEEIAATPMPAEYARWTVGLACHDCGGRAGAVRFHVLGHKCPHCASYNTRRLTLDMGGGEDGGGEGVAAMVVADGG